MFAKVYWLLPLVSALMWFSMLLGMLLVWVIDDHHERFYWENKYQSIAYISDVGATSLQPLFIAGSCVTVVLLDLALLAERWLRHTGKLAPNTSWWQKGCSIISLLAALAGAIGLILLSIYNDREHSSMHDACLAVFIVGYVVSAIFICLEYGRLGVHFREHWYLRGSFYIKVFFVVVEIALAIAFGVTRGKHSHRERNASAVIEWVIAFIFTFYILTFVIDLLPAVKTSHHYSRETVAEMGQTDPDGTYNGYPNGYTNGQNGGVNGYADAKPARFSKFSRRFYSRKA